MDALVTPTPEDIRMSEAFESLMWALARPGTRQRLAEPGLLPLAASLLDRETTVHAGDGTMAAALAATGARPAPLETAEFVFTSLAGEADAARAATASVGDPLYPDRAATVFAPATFGGGGTALRLGGPGIRGTVRLPVGGVHPSFWAARAKAIRYPLGFDLYLVAEDEVVGLPRSTRIEVI
ncbi:phosphonate C-P lyase system protein PhnH [Acuticoccus sediminis]|uniref:phosphonate C-P lyase system protein PhnH n=1 Tax=Acuticoccus sediminis TaxID=2184697 RepID=UPI001CFE915F|nr:phosphonate C-P lyase system protein PhnH [Acuticoccus sediminis]